MTATNNSNAAPVRLLNRSSVREFVDAEVAPNANEFDRAERLPPGLLQEAAALGLWGAVLPVEFGGAGLNLVSVGALHEEVGRGCSSLRSLLTVHSMVGWAVQRWGSQSQRVRWLPELAAGQALGAFCLTEPDGGADAAHTLAELSGGGWLLSGRKKWITGGQLANLFLVFAHTERGMAAFLVPREAVGVEVTPIRDLLGSRASMVAEVVLHRVAVAADALLGPNGFGRGTVLASTLDIGRYSVACGCVGIMQACLEACVSYTAQRRADAGLLRDLQLVRRMISDLVTNTRAARLLCEQAGRLKDAGDPATIMATWVAKYFASTAAVRAASDAVQIHGANGCGGEFPVARYYRDAKVMEIIEGSTELQQVTIADEAYREAGR